MEENERRHETINDLLIGFFISFSLSPSALHDNFIFGSFLFIWIDLSVLVEEEFL